MTQASAQAFWSWPRAAIRTSRRSTWAATSSPIRVSPTSEYKLASSPICASGPLIFCVVSCAQELAALRSFNMWNTKVTNLGAELVQQLTGLVLDDLMNTSQGTYLFVRK